MAKQKRTFNIMAHIEKKRQYIARKYGVDMTGLEKEVNEEAKKVRQKRLDAPKSEKP